MKPVPAVVEKAWPCQVKVTPSATVKVLTFPPVVNVPAAVTVVFALTVTFPIAVVVT